MPRRGPDTLPPFAVPDTLLLSGRPGETRMALLAGDEVVELLIDRGAPRPGAVFLGRVCDRLDAAKAVLVEIGSGPPGWLACPDPARYSPGQALLVQVKGAALPGKGPTLTLAVTLSTPLLTCGRTRPGLSLSRQIADEPRRAHLRAALEPVLQAEEAVMVRSAAADPAITAADMRGALLGLRQRWDALTRRAESGKAPLLLETPTPWAALLEEYPAVQQALTDDLALLAALRADIPAARWQADAFALAEEALCAALDPLVPLPGGGRLIIDPAAGLTVIDIDGGPLALAQANRRALPEIARQIRLRGLGGHLAVDLIPGMAKTQLDPLLEAFRQQLETGPRPTRLLGLTRLGMIELQRDRRRPSVGEMLLTPVAAQPSVLTQALSALWDHLQHILQQPGHSVVLRLPADQRRALEAHPDALQDAARRLGAPLRLETAPG